MESTSIKSISSSRKLSQNQKLYQFLFGIFLLSLLPGNYCSITKLEETIENIEIMRKGDTDGLKAISDPGHDLLTKKSGSQWDISITSIDDNDSHHQTFLCAGVLIASKVVLASASCFEYKVESQIRVRDEYDNVYKIQSIILHPGFTEGSYYNDIALLKLERPVVWSNVSMSVIPFEKNIFLNPVDVDFYDASDAGTDEGNWNGIDNELDYFKVWDLSNHDFAEFKIDVGNIPVLTEAVRIPNKECEKLYRHYYAEDSLNFDLHFPRGIDSTLFCIEALDVADCEDFKGFQLVVTNKSPLSSVFEFDVDNVVLVGTRAQALTLGNKGSSICGLNWLVRPGIYTHTVAYVQWIVDVVKSIDN